MGKPEDPRLPDGDFDHTARLGSEALAHALRHRSPPLPHAYAVWFAYVAGEDLALRARMDRELRKTRVVDLDKIEEIYREHFLGERVSSGISAIGEELEAGLGDAIAALRKGLGESEEFLGSLHQAEGRIVQVAHRRDARAAVQQLIELARAHAEQTALLKAEFDSVRAQVLELQGALQRMHDTAYLDHLTQIPNRRHLDEVLDYEIAFARASGQPLCLALGDLDHFKALNDTHGHGVGDAVLKHVAGLIRRNIKGQDTPARFGGEEFAVILPRTALADARALMDGIRAQLAEIGFMVKGALETLAPITISFGVTELQPTDTARSLIERADALLYRAKEAGRNRVEADI